LVEVEDDPHKLAVAFSRSSSWIDLFFPPLPVEDGETPAPKELRDVAHRSSKPPAAPLGLLAEAVAGGLTAVPVEDAFCAGRVG
jgi:hypothetical protein